ncbi:hypothetical protein ABG768_010226, partial [Culter alburnus]
DPEFLGTPQPPVSSGGTLALLSLCDSPQHHSATSHLSRQEKTDGSITLPG